MKSLILVLVTILTPCTQSFATDSKSQIRSLIKSYEEALNRNDVLTIVGLYSKRPVFMPQHALAQVGKKAILAAYEGVFKSIDLDIKFTIYEVEVLGDTAWARTSTTGKTKIRGNGKIVNEGNNELFILKKQIGKWKIHQYLFSTNRPKK